MGDNSRYLIHPSSILLGQKLFQPSTPGNLLPLWRWKEVFFFKKKKNSFGNNGGFYLKLKEIIRCKYMEKHSVYILQF